MSDHKPFSMEIIVPMSEWKTLPNSQALIRAWNERVGCMEKVFDAILNEYESIPTKLPYRSINGEPSLISVDVLYHVMLKNEQQNPIFTRGSSSSDAGRGRGEAVSA